MRKNVIFLMIVVCGVLLSANHKSLYAEVRINPDLLKRSWNAVWIMHPDGPFRDYGVFHFRKSFDLNSVPQNFIVHVSADNRYRLFVNGVQVSVGPARSDLNHWRFETVDIAPQLKAGRNVLAAEVWNFGVYSAVWQHSFRTAFVLQGDGEQEQIVTTGRGWKSLRDEAYSPIPLTREIVPFFCVVGPGDNVDASRYPWGWQNPEFDDSGWAQSISLGRAQPLELFQWNDTPWMLTHRTIPQLEETPERLKKIVRQSQNLAGSGFLEGTSSFTVPPHTSASILLDREELTTAYPELNVSRGAGSEIKLTYAESLWKGNAKGNRNETEGKRMYGYYDIFHPDGKERLFRPLYFRTYRYLQMDIKTAGEPLVVKDIKGIFTAYPMPHDASFECNNTELKKIWDIGWHTLRLCANETFFDCPYYEQLHYTGDDRVTAMVTLTNSSDHRLVKDAILQFYYSQQPEGLNQDRYPSTTPQYIPSYSLDWIHLIHDLWMYRGEDNFIKPLIPASRLILGWFEDRLNKEGVLNNVSWREPDYDGPMPANWNRPTARLTQEFILALLSAAELETAFGLKERAEHYIELAAKMKKDAYKAFWSHEKGLLAETQNKDKFSQHVNVLGVLADVIPGDDQKAVIQRTITMTSELIREMQSQSSYYWMYYFHKAMVKVGLGDEYIKALKPWKDMMANGLTTWEEWIPAAGSSEATSRSDCHAWSSSPNINFLTIVCGIMPASPGFKEVIIEPHMNGLDWVKGKMPHPDGSINVRLQKKGESGVEAEIELPGSISGWFVWKDKKVALKGGKQELSF